MRLGISQLGLSQWRRVGGSTPAPATPILDTITGAGAAFSLRKLRSAYTGPAIRVRRSNDNAEADIGFDGNGDLDTAALLAHCGANSGFIRTAYDQTGNGRNYGMATTSLQPRIVNAGVVDAAGAYPAMAATTSAEYLQNSLPFLFAAGSHTVMMVASIPADTGGTALFREAGSPSYYLIRTRGAADSDAIIGDINNDANVKQLNFQIILPTALDGTLKALAFRDSGSSLRPHENGSIGTTKNYTRTGTYNFTLSEIGVPPNARLLEVILFPSDISNADFNTVTADQGEAYGISVSPFLTGVDQLAVINGTGDGGPSLAINLMGPQDWQEPLFLDRAKQGREFLRGSTFDEVPAANKAADGGLASLPAGETQAKFLFNTSIRNSANAIDPLADYGGRFQFKFTSGAVSSASFIGCTNVTQIDATTWEFDYDWDATVTAAWCAFTPTSFPIKVSLIKTTDIAAVASGDIFQPAFLSGISTGMCLRFMDWMGTNNSPYVNIEDYPPENNQTFTTVPLEVITGLCNLKSAHPWICIPHKATDAFVTAWATYLRDNLNPALKIRVELSNEIWNTGLFTQGAYFKGLVESVWGAPDGYASYGWLHYAGKRFAQIMQIFNTVFAGQTNRLIGVIAGQTAGGGVPMADATQWQTNEPGDYVPPYTLAKEASFAPYLNWVGGATSHGNAIKAQLDISHEAAVAYMKGMLPASLEQSKGWIDTQATIAGARGLRMTMYEYNNHYSLGECNASSLYSGGSPVAGALAVFREAAYSQEFADAQDELRTYFKEQNGSLMAFYRSQGVAANSGTWGARTHSGHISAIWNALQAWHTANGRWWAQ